MNTIFKYITIIVLGLFAHNSFAQHNGEIIIPITVDEITIDSVRHDIIGILDGDIDSSLVELELKKSKRNHFKRNGYEVDVSFACYDAPKKGKKKLDIENTSSKQVKLNYWRYGYHGKWGMYVSDSLLSYINDTYLAKLPYEDCKYNARLFVRKYIMNLQVLDYLYVSVESKRQKVELIFMYSMGVYKVQNCI